MAILSCHVASSCPSKSVTVSQHYSRRPDHSDGVAKPGHSAKPDHSRGPALRRKTITGSLSGQGSVTPITNSKGTAFFSSSGTTTVLGSATFYGFVPYFANKRHAVRYARGVGVLQDLSGDKIVVSFSGYDRDTSGAGFHFLGERLRERRHWQLRWGRGSVHRHGKPQQCNGRLLDPTHREARAHLNVLDSRCQNSKFQTPERLRANPESGVEKRDGSDSGRLLHAQDFITT